MIKNQASQRWIVLAFTAADGLPLAGDAANITAKIALDGAALGATNDVNPTELESGRYAFDLTQAETNADELHLVAVSSTSGKQVIGLPEVIYPSEVVALIGGIGSASGGALNFSNSADNVDASIKSIAFDGVETSGTNASVNNEDGTYHVIDDATNNIDIVYTFPVGGSRTGVEVTWKGYLAGSNDTASIQVYNGSGWDTVATINGKNGSTNDTITAPLLASQTGTGSDLGDVHVRIECASQSNPTLNTDLLQVAAVNVGQSVGYANGFLWVDANGTAGSESYVNGTADNPTTTLASVETLSTALSIKKLEVANGTTITLDQTFNNWVIQGHEWTLALGGQSVASSMFIDAAVSGTGTGTDAEFEDCIFGITSLPAMQAYNCSFTANTSGGFTMSAAGDYRFINCQSGVAGASSPLFTLAAATITAEFRRWSGGIAFAGITSDDVLTISGELGTIDLGSPSGAADIQIRGTYKAITNAGSASVNTAGAILAADSSLAAAQAEVTGVPASTASLGAMIRWLYALSRNKGTQTATTKTLRNDADDGSIATSTVSDDDTTFTRGEWS